MSFVNLKFEVSLKQTKNNMSQFLRNWYSTGFTNYVAKILLPEIVRILDLHFIKTTNSKKVTTVSGGRINLNVL